jgi:hypothetical protein
MRTVIAFVSLLAAAAPAAAQHVQHAHGHAHAGGEFPAGWQGRVDRPTQNIDDVRFMAMDDHFHVVTGPHVILWDPSRTASGEYRASVTVEHRRAPERLEGVGLLVGGQDLDGAGQDYLYFLMRHDGQYMVRHRAGDEVHTLAEWTEHPAVNRPTAEAGSENRLAIDARAGRVAFFINGTEVQAFDRVPMLNTDGIVGFRIGHHLDVHLRDFVVEPGSPD